MHDRCGCDLIKFHIVFIEIPLSTTDLYNIIIGKNFLMKTFYLDFMKEIIQEKRSPSDPSFDECCSIAESMMQEIQVIKLMERRLDESASNSKQKGSLKRKVMRQIEQVLQMSMVG